MYDRCFLIKALNNAGCGRGKYLQLFLIHRSAERSSFFSQDGMERPLCFYHSSLGWGKGIVLQENSFMHIYVKVNPASMELTIRKVNKELWAKGLC